MSQAAPLLRSFVAMRRPQATYNIVCMTDGIVQRIERFTFSRGAVLVERRNRGYSLYHAASGAPVARQ